MGVHHPRGTCNRCFRGGLKIETTFPDGPLCTTCYEKGVHTRGVCPGCGDQRLLPGMDEDGQPLCVDCAGIDTRSYFCSRCPNEWALRLGVCEWCYLDDLLNELLPGPINLRPLHDRLLSAARPDSIVIWLQNRRVRRLLRSLSEGDIPLDHEGLDTFESRRIGDHLRCLLVEVDLLPRRDEVLARFDRWIADNLHNLSDQPDELHLLDQFTRWHLRPSLVAKAAQAPLRIGQKNHCTYELRIVAKFLAWLRHRNRTLATCRQADFDEWWADPNSANTAVRTFMKWAISTNLAPRLKVGYRKARRQPMITQDQRLAALKATLSPDTGPLLARVAAMLLLLLAQPLQRVAALRIDDVTTNPQGTRLRLGDQHVDIPEPFGELLRRLVEQRPNANTATNPGSRWLFPGGRAGHHRSENTLRADVRSLGIEILAARNAALRQLVLDCPAPVVAVMLNYSQDVIDRHAVDAGATWTSYAADRAAAAE